MLIYVIFTNLVMIYAGYKFFPYEKPVLFKFTEIYNESKLLNKHFWRLIGTASFLMFIECFYSYYSTKSFLANNIGNSLGRNMSQDITSICLLLSSLILFLGRMYFISMNRGNMILMFGFVLFIMLIVGTILSDAFYKPIDSDYMIFLLKSQSFWYTMLHSTLVPLFVEYIYICGIRSNLIYPAYKMIVSRYKSKDLNFFAKTGREKISKLLRYKVEFQLSNVVKSVYNGIRSLDIEDDVKKILSMDSNNFNLGINQYTCKIIDPNDLRRFNIFNTKK